MLSCGNEGSFCAVVCGLVGLHVVRQLGRREAGLGWAGLGRLLTLLPVWVGLWPL